MTVKDDVTVIAHVWNDPGKPGKPRKILVSTIGTMLDADPVELLHKKKDEETGLWTNVSKFIKQSALIKHYFDWAGAIDRHNRKRMDGLQFELTHEFKVWWKRILLSFIAVIIVDAFCCFVMEHGDTDQLQFYKDLAEEMINNRLDGAPARDWHSKRGRRWTCQNWKQGDMPENPSKRR